MAQIILNVKTNTSQATADLKKLETQVSNLSKSLSNVSTPKSGSELAKPLENTGKAAKTSAQNIETLRRSVANLLSQIKTLEKQFAGGLFTNTRNNVRDLLTAVDRLSKSFRNGTKSEQDYAQVTAELSKEYKKLAADTAQLRAENEKLATSDPFSPKQGDSIFRLQKQYASLVNTIKSAEQYYPKGTFDEIKTSAQGAVTGLQALGQEYTTTGTLSEASQTKLNNFSKSLYQQQAAYETTKNSATNYHGTLRDLITGFAKFQLSAMLVMKPLQLLTSAWNSLNETLVETEKAVVSLQRVLDEDIASGEISSELYAIAQNLGQTFDNVQEIAQNFAKAGLSWQGTLQATEAAVLALNVAELTAEESSEGLIAVMQQFNYEASELTYVIDVLNKAADKSAVDTADLLVALQKTGSYAAAANLSLEETVGLISALSEATAASGQNIGNALKSLFAYSSKSSSLEMFASLSDEMKAVVDMYQIGNASILDVWEKLAETMGNLSSEQANLLEQWSSESGLETELGSALGDVYDQLTGVYDTAGVYRKNYFIALLNNFDEVQNVMGEISDAQGYTAEEQAKYMDTYEAKLNALQSKWEEIANDEQGLLAVKKGLIDIASGLLTAFQYTGGIRTLLIAVGSAIAAIFAPKIVNGFASIIGWIKSLPTLFKSATFSVQSFGAALQGALGIAGLIATAISAIVGAVQQAKEEQAQRNQQAREEALSSWEALKEETQELTALNAELEKYSSIQNLTTQEEDDYKKVQEDIISLLGERAIALKSLTEGTDEYIQKLKELTQEELKERRDKAQAAANAAWGNFNSDYFGGITFGEVGGRFSEVARNELQNGGSWGNYFSTGIDNILADYANRYGENSKIYTEAVNQLYAAKEAYEAALQSSVEASVSDFLYTNGSDITETDIDEITESILSAYAAGEEYRDQIKGWIIDFSGFQKEVEETGDDLEDQISRIEDLTDDTLDKLVSKLKEVRDAEKESEEIEERKKDLLEAQQELLEKQKALEDARNSRGLYRLNAETGQFEWVQDEKAIKDAEEDVADAQQEVDEILAEIGDDARDAVIDELESGNATNESIKEILDKWYAVAVLQSGADTSWYQDLINFIKEEAGVDLSTVGQVVGSPTEAAEVASVAAAEAIDPALAAKMFQPTSSAEFNQLARSMGIMFEQQRAYSPTPVVQTPIANTTTNNNSNNSYVINGVRIGSDSLEKPFSEVLRMVGLVPKA